MKKTFIRLAALMLAVLTLVTGGVGVYADDSAAPFSYVQYDSSFDLIVGSGYARFICDYSADPAVFDHAELEMTLQKKGWLFWSDVDIQISQIWMYETDRTLNLRQDIPDETGKYRALYTLRVVGNNGRTDTIEQTVEYTYN